MPLKTYRERTHLRGLAQRHDFNSRPLPSQSMQLRLTPYGCLTAARINLQSRLHRRFAAMKACEKLMAVTGA